MANLGDLKNAFVTVERKEDIIINEINNNSVVQITSTEGAIFVLREINGNSRATFVAPNGVFIQGKVDGNSSVSVCTHESIIIGGEVNGNSCASLFSSSGAISINGQINGNSSVLIFATGIATIGGSVQGNSFVHWFADELSIGGVDADSRVIKYPACSGLSARALTTVVTKNVSAAASSYESKTPTVSSVIKPQPIQSVSAIEELAERTAKLLKPSHENAGTIEQSETEPEQSTIEENT